MTGGSWAQVVTTYSYDAQGQVTKVIRASGVVSYTYDAAGNRLALGVAEAPPSAANASLSAPYQTGGSTWLTTSGVYTQIALVTPPSHGGATVAVGANGNPAIANYLPANGFYGADNFTYNVTGPGGTSAPASVTVTVAPPSAPTASNVALTVPYQTGGSTWLTTSGVYTQIALVTPPSHGGATVAAGANGNPAIANYLPANGFYGADSFTYNVTGPGGTSATATVSITVTPSANHAPVAINDSASVALGSTVDINVVANDTDADGNALTMTSLSAYGTTRATYDILGGVIEITAFNKKGADVITYTVSDGQGGTATATLTVTFG